MRSRTTRLLLGLSLVLGACDPVPIPPPPKDTNTEKPSGEVTVSYPEEPVSLNPYMPAGDTIATRDALRPMLPTLLTIDPKMRYQRGLAIRVPRGADISKDRRSVFYRLDPKAVWSDGHPMTASDVRFTWEAIKDSRLPVTRASYRLLNDVQIVSPTSLRLVFDSYVPRWREMFSAGDFILPKHALEGKDLSKELVEGPPVSGGPFHLGSWTKGLEIELTANPRWWRQGPSVERVRMQFVPDTEIALGLLENGRTDVLVSSSQRGLEGRAERLEGVQVSSRFGSAWWELVFNCSRAPMDDVRFRQAVASGIDRAGIVEALVRGEGRPLQHLLPGQKAPPSFARHVRDPATLREKLRSAGFKEGQEGRYSKGGAPIGISTSATHSLARFVLLAIRQNVREAGLQLELRSPVPEVLYGRWQASGEFDIALVERRGSPGMSLSGTYRSDRHPAGGRNYSRISSPELDGLLDSAEVGNDVGPLMEKLAELLPALPIFETKLLMAHRHEVVGTDPNATVDGPFWNIHLWSRAG